MIDERLRKKLLLVAGATFLLYFLFLAVFLLFHQQRIIRALVIFQRERNIYFEMMQAIGTRNLLIKKCPEEWYVNKMPGVWGERQISLEYFIYQGERREISEFDVDWVKSNCLVQPVPVY